MPPPPFSTADLYDAHPAACQSCSIQLRQFGGRRHFFGPIRTVKCRNDNVRVRQLLETPSQGGVLAVDGGDSLEAALLGDILAELGRKNGWAGIVIFGAVRDVSRLSGIEFGIKALGANPRKSRKEGTGQTDVIFDRGGAAFMPGHWLYSDDDGLLISAAPLH